MSDAIIVAIITGVCALLGNYLANRKAASLLEYKLQQLEIKVDKHNTVVERMYAIEKRADVFDEKIDVANHRIEDLEKLTNK